MSLRVLVAPSNKEVPFKAIQFSAGEPHVTLPEPHLVTGQSVVIKGLNGLAERLIR